ncbi:MAG: ATP-binding protein [Bacteroidota bacterium]
MIAGAKVFGEVFRRSRLFGLVFFVVLLLGLSHVVEYLVIRHVETHWETIVEDVAQRYITRAEYGFVSAQRTTRRHTTEVAQRAEVVSFLNGNLSDRSALASYVSNISREYDVGIEVFDRRGTLVVWEGRSGPSTEREVQIALDGQLTSYVNSGPIYSHLFVTTPVRQDGRIVGVVIGRQAIEVNYPLNNKFINREGLSLRLSEEFGVPVEFNFVRDAPLRKDGRYVSARLYGIDSTEVGVVSVMRPSRTSYLENTRQPFKTVNVLLEALLVAVMGIWIGYRINNISSAVLRSIGITLLIWLVRYVLLWLDFPGSLIAINVFDPAHFASKFGGGLAKSIGEMTLTVLALLLNVSLILTHVLSQLGKRSLPGYVRNPLVRATCAVAATILIFLLLRGYGASLRSAVFDSTLNFADPGVIVPTFPLGLMIFNLFLISFCLIVVTVGLTSFILTLLSPSRNARWSLQVPWVGVGALFAVAAVLFGELQPNPLMSTPYRILFATLILLCTYFLHRRVVGAKRLVTPGSFLVVLGLSAVFLYPLLDAKVREKDGGRLEAFAAEALRPVDGWLAFVVEEALAGFLSDETVDILTSEREEEVQKLAFTHWARSAVSREGYNCRFLMVDAKRKLLSQFTLGSQSFFDAQVGILNELPLTKSIQVREIGLGINAVKVYVGSVPIMSADGGLFGWGVVAIAAEQQSLFRGESPAVLRSIAREDIESFHRRVTISEFRQGVLFATTNPEFPIGYELPQEVRGVLDDSSRASFWFNETVNEVEFESYAVRRSASEGGILVLSIEKLGLPWHLFNIVKVTVYYSIVAVIALLGFLMLRWWHGVPYVASFRDRLLGALLFTSVVPLIVLAISGRTIARERLIESTSRRLQQETGAVAANIIQRVGTSSPEIAARLSPAFTEQLANDLGIDFNIYLGSTLTVSSRPELYEAGILDRRISGNAFVQVYAGGRRFHLETERIGGYQYAVGFAPMLDENNAILGVVSVPTLYQQEQIEQEVSQRNAVLFGAYAVVLFIMIIVATAFANRIARPIHRLTEATRRVSQGDLDVDVRLPNVDGEIGELMTSFEKMTQDLKRSREELVRAEREMAWKEMARQVAHEIKNPLTPMKLSLQHLRQTYRDDVPNFSQVFDEVSKTIIEQIDALSRIASEFSHFARMPQPRLEECDLRGVILESVHLFEQDSSVVFDIQIEDPLPPIVVDREELRRAFINIIRNSIQAMNNSGRVTISARSQMHGVHIQIKDVGPGIPEEMKGKLFQPNFSTKTDGMGLGLAIVKKTIDDLGGTISIESTGEGTTVTITLPAKAI